MEALAIVVGLVVWLLVAAFAGESSSTLLQDQSPERWAFC
jgi:hypothetical protein